MTRIEQFYDWLFGTISRAVRKIGERWVVRIIYFFVVAFVIWLIISTLMAPIDCFSLNGYGTPCEAKIAGNESEQLWHHLYRNWFGIPSK